MLEVGTIARAHGLRGQVVVELVTNRTERVSPGSVLESDRGPLEVVAAAPGPGSGGRDRWIVTFLGIASREAAEALRGLTLRAEPLEDPDVLWVHDLIGSAVVDAGGAQHGTVTDVQANPASDLLVLDTGGLIPLRFVVAHEAGRVTVDIPAGLLDL